MDQSLLQTKLYVPNIPRGFVHRSPLYKKMDLVSGEEALHYFNSGRLWENNTDRILGKTKKTASGMDFFG